MSNNPGSASAPAKETQPPQRDNHRSRSHHPNRTKPRIVKFKGKCEELMDAIFKISSASGGNSFTKAKFTKAKRDVAEYVARKIPEYVARKIPGSGESYCHDKHGSRNPR